MSAPQSRRRFLQTAAAGSLLGAGDLSLLAGLRPVSAAEARLDPKLVRLDPDIEPLVHVIEDTPREELLDRIAGRVRKGLGYRDLLAAVLLAGVRNIQPRPSVGFKFHAVLVVNSAHLASLASPDSERWLPLFWALDNFKASQATNLKEGGWRMAPVDESKLPPAHKARQAFCDAMDNWDVPAADVAVAALARTAGAHELFGLFSRYGARDFRDIGHKAIYVANSWRTLQVIGWRHAEPVLRSLAYALLKYDGDNPAKSDAAADRPGRDNRELARRIRPEWQEGRPSKEGTLDILAALRTGGPADACGKVAEALNKGLAPQSVWDALHLGAGELLLRQPGIVALHAVTSTNAFRHTYELSGDDEARRWFLLQNAAFVTLFRDALKGRGKVADHPIEALEPAEVEKDGAEGVAEIFRDAGKDKLLAARKTLAYRQGGGDAKPLMDTARLLVFFKGNDSHDYKFSAAVLEDYELVSPEWRDRVLASAMMQFRGSTGPDTGVLKRVREALKG
jgi:hypothetical protein